MQLNKQDKILLAALVLSIGAHASTFVLWDSATDENWVRPGQIQVNVVALSSKVSEKKKTSDVTHETENFKPGSGAMFQANKDTRNMVGSNSPQETEGVNNTEKNNSQNSTANKLTVQLRGKIKTALQKHLTYPPIARRRGWQGTVTIHITVRGNGELQQVKLSKSSGYSLLDNSAIAALQKVGRIDELKPLLQGKTIPIELPIKYLLEDFEYDAPSV